jgi:hypothetical protein
MTHPVEEVWTSPPRQRRRHPIVRRIVLVSLALLVALATVFAILYQRAASELDEHVTAASASSEYVAVVCSPKTNPAMSCDDIITLIGVYGTMLDHSACAPYDIFEPKPSSQEHYWSLKNPYLLLRTTVLPPPDWEAQLQAQPIEESIDTRLLRDGTPTIIKSVPGLDGGAR